MTSDLHTVLLGMGGTAMLGKVALMAARSLPPPPEQCGFWRRWFYDFTQIACENQDKAGKVQDPAKPIGQEKQQISASATTVDTPKGVDVLAVATPASAP